MAKLVVARDTFACDHDGAEAVIHMGDRLAADHPIAKAHAELFEPANTRPDLDKPAAK